MQVYPSKQQFKNSPEADSLLSTLLNYSDELLSDEAVLYHKFPLYRDDEGGILVADAMLLSQRYGVVGFFLLNDNKDSVIKTVGQHAEAFEQLPSYIYSRLIRNKGLRRSATQLSFDVSPVVYAPFAEGIEVPEAEGEVLTSDDKLVAFLRGFPEQEIDDDTFWELVATIDGAKV